MSLYAEFDLPLTAYPLGRHLTDSPGITVTIDRIVPVGETFHYVWIKGEDHERFVEKLESDELIPGLKIIDSLPDRTLIRVDWAPHESPIFRLLEESDARIESLRGSRAGWTLAVRFPAHTSLQAFYETSKDAAVDIDLEQIYESNGLREGDKYGVSERQYSALLLALQEGYFEIPRQTSVAELAERLGISEQAVSERLRRGLSAVIEANDIGSETDHNSD